MRDASRIHIFLYITKRKKLRPNRVHVCLCVHDLQGEKQVNFVDKTKKMYMAEYGRDTSQTNKMKKTPTDFLYCGVRGDVTMCLHNLQRERTTIRVWDKKILVSTALLINIDNASFWKRIGPCSRIRGEKGITRLTSCSDTREMCFFVSLFLYKFHTLLWDGKYVF